MNFFDILVTTIPVFAIVAVGCVTRAIGLVTDDSEKSIMRLVVNVLYPCFILSKVFDNQSLQQWSVVGLSLIIGFVLMITGLAISYGAGRAFKLQQKDDLNTFCLSTAIQNYGFMPIPLIVALFENSDATLGVMFIHNLGLELAMWSVGIVVLSGTFAGATKRLINGPTIAIIFGLAVNYSGASQLIPGFATETIIQLGNCAIPIALLLVGATLVGVLQREKWVTDWKVVTGAVTVRFVIMPILFLTVASLVSFAPELSKVLIIQSAMPAGIFPIVLAKHFGGKPQVAVQVSIATSVVCLLMTPLLLTYALKWFGIGA